MNLGIYDIIIDFSKLFVHNSTGIYFKEGDLNTAKVRAKLTMKNKMIDITGCNVTILIETSEGEVITDNATVIDPYSGIIEIEFKSNTLLEGTHLFEVWIIKDDSIKKSGKLAYRVLDSIEDAGSIEGTNEYPILISLISYANKAIQDAKEVLNIAKDMESNVNEAIGNTNVAISNAEVATSNANAKIAELDEAKTKMIKKVDSSIDTMKTDVNTAKEDMKATTDAKIQQVDNSIAGMKVETNTAIDSMVSKTDEKIADIDISLAAGTKDLEVKEARIDMDGVEHDTLKLRLESDLEKGSVIYSHVEGSNISTDSENGYIENLIIEGNTYQNPNKLEEILSTGDKIEGQALYKIPLLSVGKNLFNKDNLYIPGYTITGATHVDRKGFNIKVKPSTTYVVTSKGSVHYAFFDAKGVFISGTFHDNSTLLSKTITTPSNCVEIRLGITYQGSIVSDFNTLQLEEGSVATNYEPYQSDKLTILSPTPIEKVGDVPDRIIEKDGVWGVEKPVITTYVEDDDLVVAQTPLDNTIKFTWTTPKRAEWGAKPGMPAICNTIPYKDGSNDEPHVRIDGSVPNGALALWVNRSDLKTPDVAGLKQFAKDTSMFIKFVTSKPQFIPLPHSQQIKLRTFAPTTNISFLTEIEGTIKGDVPKSRDATVNTHTTQIDALNKDLERVKKLEEATTSTVVTESNFISVEETSSGFFENLKLEGRTLVNEGCKVDNKVYPKWIKIKSCNVDIGTTYTSTIKNTGEVRLDLKNITLNELVQAISPGETKTISFIAKDAEIGIVNYTEGLAGFEWILIKGDHTQNPPSFFEGMKSVGDDVDEIVVSTIKGDGNLFNEQSVKMDIFNNSKYINTTSYSTKPSISLPKNDTYRLSFNDGLFKPNDGGIVIWSDNIKSRVVSPNNSFTLSGNENAISFYAGNFGTSPYENLTLDMKIMLNKGDKPKLYTSYKVDKKQLLFLDTADNTWKKPALRDSGEVKDLVIKYSNGKYYYHKRNHEIILDGVNFRMDGVDVDGEEYISFFKYNDTFPQGKRPLRIEGKELKVKSDKLNNVWVSDREGVTLLNHSTSSFRIRLLKTKCTDVETLNTYSQTNPIAFVYPLEKEEIYECTPIDLISFENETNYMVESGVLSPKTTIKCVNYIGNVINTLKEKVSLLEDKLYKTNLANFTVALNTLDTKLRLDRLEAPQQ